MASDFSGVAAFVAQARKAPSEKSKFSMVARSLTYDLHGGIDDSEDDDDDDEDRLFDFSDEDGQDQPPVSFGELTTTLQASISSGKYKLIHTDCKHRLYNLLDVEKPEKIMTLGQLREVMGGCLEGKKAKDGHSKQNGHHLVTLENYLFEFLEQRYNSDDPAEIKEWFVTLSKAINKYGIFDSDICIFGKMLRNTLSETFPEHQRVLHKTADKLMQESMTATAWSKRMHDGVPFNVFDKAVSRMFNAKDAAEILRRVKDPMPRTGKRGGANLEALTRDHVRYLHGIEVLLTFNMHLQDDFLHDFVVAYRKVDLGKDGVLNTAEVSDLVNLFGTVDNIKEGSSSHSALREARATTQRNIRKARRMTFSETVDNFMDLLSARWSVTGKKGTRYQQHDNLKNLLMPPHGSVEKRKSATGAELLKSRLKKISNQEKEAQKTKKNVGIDSKKSDSPKKTKKNVGIDSKPLAVYT